jgi:hypothetical protein
MLETDMRFYNYRSSIEAQAWRPALNVSFGSFLYSLVGAFMTHGSKERIQSNRGTLCQGGDWCYCGSLRYGAPFYGDNNLKHNYDLLGMKAVIQFSMRQISQDFGFMNEQELIKRHRIEMTKMPKG